MRPLYETQQDINNETSVAQILESAWNVSLVKLPIAYKVDYGVMSKGKFAGWVEIKCRNVVRVLYPDIILSVNKWLDGKRLANDTDTKFLLVVKFQDCICYSDETNKAREVGFGGRTDRGDSQDMEPVIRIPITDFLLLKGG